MKQRKPTIKSIAAELGISPTTVSFVLNGRDKGISRETAGRIVLTACKMGYTRPGRMQMRDWQRVAYVLPRIANLATGTTFYQEVYNQMQAQGERNHIETVMRELDASATPETFFRQYEALLRQDFDVFVTHDYYIAKLLREKGAKTILAQGGQLDDCICIYCDDLMAGRMAAEYALEMGHRRAGMIFPTWGIDNPRYRGFSDFFLRNGGDLPDKFCWLIPSDHEEAAAVLNDKISHAKGPLPTFFYCFADNIMFPAIRSFIGNGLKVPDNVSLMGTDNLYWGKVATPAFSTIDLQEEMFAARIIKGIKETVLGYTPYQLAIPVRLLPRETVKKLS